MSQEKKMFGASVAEEKKQEAKMDDGSADITEQSGEDLIATLTAEAKQKSKSRKKKKIEEYKAIRATKDAIFSRLGRTIDVPIIMDDEEIMVFKVKRLSESENSDIIDRTLAVKNVKEMTPEEKLKYVDDSETELETAFSSVSTDDVDLQLYLDKVLTKKQKEFLDLILTGYDREEIKKKMNIEKSMYYKLLSSITQKIKGGKND